MYSSNCCSCHFLYLSCDFFFQAEDGIRDGHVTGVQTCALPISNTTRSGPSRSTAVRTAPVLINVPDRSEERRVGKECSAPRSPSSKSHKIKSAPETRSRWCGELSDSTRTRRVVE